MVILGGIALAFGVLGIVASIIRGAQLEYEKSHNNEMSAIGWFILAALCFR